MSHVHDKPEDTGARRSQLLRYIPPLIALLLGGAASVYAAIAIEEGYQSSLRADFERRLSRFQTFLSSDLTSEYTADMDQQLGTVRANLEASEQPAEVISSVAEGTFRSDWLNATTVWYPRVVHAEENGDGTRVSYPPAAVAAPDLGELLASEDLTEFAMARSALAIAERHDASIAFGRVDGEDVDDRSIVFVHVRPVYNASDAAKDTAPEVGLKGFVAGNTQTTLGGFSAQFPMAMGGLEAILIQRPEANTEGWQSDFDALLTEAAERYPLLANTPVETAGHQWTLVAVPNEEFYSFHAHYNPLGIAGAGLGITALLALYLLRVSYRSRRIEELVHERTRELLESNEQLAREIAEHHRTADALRASESRYKLVGEKISDVIWTYDTEWKCTFISPGIVNIRGYSVEEVMEQQLEEMMTPDSFLKVANALRDVHEKIEQDGLRPYEYTLELEMTRKDGSTVWTEVRTNLLLNDEGTELLGYLGVTRDISQRKEVEKEKAALEQQLRQSQKMEAIGVLAGGVAHDFNNLLTGILGYANMLKAKYTEELDVMESADVIEKAAQRAADLTKQLLGFARQGKLQNTQVNLHEAIDDSVNLLSRTLDKRITIARKLCAKTAMVLGDPSQLQLVVLNLAVNARDAMPDGGTLTMRTERVEIERDFCRTHAEARPGEYVRLSVEDTGTGIPPEVRERIFEPFFTTKQMGQGTGMGLATVYGIVKNHGGFVTVYSEMGQGTTFHVYLPQESANEFVTDAPATSNPVHGNGRILVVDDEEVVRQIAAKMLEWLGYEVKVVKDGAEAVEYYEEHGDSIDLVLIDMVMPRMNGRECFIALKQINPNVRAVLCTGYSRDGAAQEILDEGMRGFVQKPYHTQELSETIANALGSAHSIA